MSRHSFTQRHPYWFVILVELMVIAAYLGAGTVAHLQHLDEYAMLGLAQGVLILALAGIVTRLGWWSRIGFRRASVGGLLLVAPILLPAFTNLYPGLAWPGLAAAAGFLALALGIGFVEEVTYRGLMLQALAPRGKWTAIVLTTVMFSLTHLMNMMSGENWWQAVMQLGYTAAIGFAFAALMLRGSAIWPLIIVHGLIDFVAFMSNPALTLDPVVEASVNGVITVAFVGYGLWILRRPAAHTEPAPGLADSAPAPR